MGVQHTIEQSWDLSDFNIRKINTSEVYTTGSTYMTNEGDEVILIGQSTYKRFKEVSGKLYPYYDRVVIQFPEGHYTEVSLVSLKNGKLKNHLRNSNCAVGRIGVGNAPVMINKKHSPEYAKWSNLLTRCHNEKRLKKRPEYADCTISPEWYDYQNFYRDIHHLPGYTEFKSLPGQYELDKDIKVMGNRHYSKETCVILTRTLNSMITSMKGWGVFKTSLGKYTASTGSLNKRAYLGTFFTEYDARKAYLKEKREHTKIILNSEKSIISEEVYQIVLKYINDWWEIETVENEKSTSRTANVPVYVATRMSDEYTEEFYTFKEFSDKYALHSSNVSRCCRGLQLFHKGWKFKIKEKTNDKD